MSLSDDVAREFGHVKESQDRIETHLFEQDKHLSDHFRRFQQHILDDQVMKIAIDAHIAEHKEQSRHRWVIISGIILTAASSLGILLVELLKHFYLKG